MTVKIPINLEKALSARAKERQISLEELVREALFWYLQLEESTIDELNAWQEVRDEALRLVEDPPS
jgi:predicted transcriptional regulator